MKVLRDSLKKKSFNSSLLNRLDMLYVSGKIKKLEVISAALIIGSIFICISFIRSYYEDQIRHYKMESAIYKETLDRLKTKVSMPRYPFATSYERKDYHDYWFMEIESVREGPGEHGEPYVLDDYQDIKRNTELAERFGFYCVASDHISVNRSLPDIRLPQCRNKKYLKQLSKVSIIIVFFDEYWSILLRTIHSIYNRTPHELLEEIIIVNDNSTLVELYEPLETYVNRNFNDLVRIHVLKERKGLVGGRLEGARRAKGDILVFLDAQVEVNVNWLPPLIEPIALTPRLLTTPIVDNFAFDTFEYRKLDDGGRGIFNWDLHYRRFPRRPKDKLVLDEPIPTPVMVGTAFAINRQNFWDLGSYDDGLKVWQGEHLDLSFKAQLCGIGIVEIPCSRVAHSYRSKNYYARYGDDGVDYMIRNFKRIAETWLDEFKNVVYKRNPKYATADTGPNMVRPKTIRRGLHCKPFRYFLEFVAPEMLERYPLENPGHFAQGAIQSKANSNLCLEIPKGQRKIAVAACDKNLFKPSVKQFFKLAYHRNIQHYIFDFCLQDSLTVAECHFLGGNQYWKFDLMTSQLTQTNRNITRCLSLNSNNNVVSVEACNSKNLNQKWNFGEKNVTALQNWETFGVDLSTLKF